MERAAYALLVKTGRGLRICPAACVAARFWWQGTFHAYCSARGCLFSARYKVQRLGSPLVRNSQLQPEDAFTVLEFVFDLQSLFAPTMISPSA